MFNLLKCYDIAKDCIDDGICPICQSILEGPTNRDIVLRRKLIIQRKFIIITKYSGTSPYGHLTSKKTSPLQSPWLSPKLYSTVQITPCNKVTSALRSLLPSPVGDLNSEVPL